MMPYEELFEADLKHFGIDRLSEETRKELFDEYKVFDSFIEDGDLCWESNMLDLLIQHKIISEDDLAEMED